MLISTQDRSDSLKETLQLLARNDIDRDRLDVLVIENASEPTARAVTESMSAKLSVRYLHDGRVHERESFLVPQGRRRIAAFPGLLGSGGSFYPGAN